MKNIKYPLLIDGGLANQLEKQGCDLKHSLWSAKLLVADPEQIIEAHLAYLESGAQCIITSSYQANVPGFNALGYSDNEAKKFIFKTVELAEEAIKRSTQDGNPLIAASIGPYGAFLSDGSEYHGNYQKSDQEIEDFHLPRINILDESNAHFFACETIPSFQEAKVLAKILDKTTKQAWVSFSCKDGKHLNDGTPIAQAGELFADHKNVFAIGVNCTAPQHISGLIKSLKTILKLL